MQYAKFRPVALLFFVVLLSFNAWGATNLPLGTTTTGTIGAAGQTNTYVFSANTGDVIDFTVVPTGNLSAHIQVFTSNGTTPFASAENTFTGCAGGPVELNTVTLPASPGGTYIVWINDCANTNTGGYTIYPQLTKNPIGPSSLPFGQAVTGTLASAALNDTYTFDGNGGDVVDFSIIAPGGGFDPRFRLYNLDGSLLKEAKNIFTGCAGGELEMNTVTLPSTGTYTLLVGDCNDTYTGNYTMFVQSTLNPVGTVTEVLWGQTQAGTVNVVSGLTTSTAYAFTGAANDTVYFTVSPTGNLDPRVRIYDPTGTLLIQAENTFTGCAGGPLPINALKLPASGRYIAFIDDCNHVNGGSYNLSTQCIGVCELPVPTLTSIAPTSALAGSATFTLTANGTNFIDVNPSTVVQWNGNPLATTFVNSGQLTAQVPVADIATAGVFPITVFTPAPGGGTSSVINFSVNNPVPTVSLISPTSTLVGGAAFTLTVMGSNFVQDSVVQWNGNALATTYVSATKLTAAVPASDLTTAGTASATVFNPTPGGGTSTPAHTFSINNPAPSLTSLSPANTPVGGPAFTLTVNGSNFIQTSTVNWNGSGRPTTYVSSTELEAAIRATDIAAAATIPVTVTNPGPGGGTSPSVMFPITAPVATPTFSVAGGTYTTPQSVAISDTTSGAVIYYTVSPTGVTPTTNSTRYTGTPIPVSNTETIEAIAVASGSSSQVAVARYTITPPAPAPAFSVASGTYTAAQTVTISDSASGVTIYYAINGTPTTSSTVYSSPITVSSTETIEAIASGNGYSASPVAIDAITIKVPAATPTFSLAAGSYSGPQTLTISDTTPGASIFYAINGTATTSSTAYTGPITISSSETVEAIATATGYGPSNVTGASYVIQPVTTVPVIDSVSAVLPQQTQTITISGSGFGTKAAYSGNSPYIWIEDQSGVMWQAGYDGPGANDLVGLSVTSWTDTRIVLGGFTGSYGGTWFLSSGDKLNLSVWNPQTGAGPGTCNMVVGAGATSCNSTATMTPSITPPSGVYAAAQTVSITDSTYGATIYFTTDGSTPTTSSPMYGGSITVSAPETIHAIAVAPGFSLSSVATAHYGIGQSQVALNVLPSSEPVGTLFALTATVTDSKSSPITVGTVNFYDGTTLLGSAQVIATASGGGTIGTATLNTILIPLGSNSITASYSGPYVSGTSPAVTATVTGQYPSSTLLADAGSVGNYTLTGVITGWGPGTPTGNVKFTDTTTGLVLGSAPLDASTVANTFANPTTLGGYANPVADRLADVDGNGVPDLLIGDSTGLWLSLGKGDGTFKTATQILTGAIAAQGIVVGDFNRDGHVDLAVGTAGMIVILLGKGDGTFTTGASFDTGSPSRLVAGDFNSDGIVDIAALNSATVDVLVGHGDGTFKTPVTYAVQSPLSMTAGDLNGDGNLDLVVGTAPNQITVLLGNGDGTLQTGRNYATPYEPGSLLLGDFRAIGKLDLVTAFNQCCEGSNTTAYILPGNGDGTFAAPQPVLSGTNYSGAAAADLDGDGHLDLVISEFGSPGADVLKGNGDDTFQTASSYSAGVGPITPVVGDLNQDGRPDILVPNYNDGTATILINDVTDTATLANVLVPGSGQHSVSGAYSGDTSFAGSVSNSDGLSASLLAPTMQLTANPGTTANYGQLSVTATLSSSVSWAPSPSGTVTYTIDTGAPQAAAIASGKAVIDLSKLAVGAHAVMVSYGGDTYYSVAPGQTLTVTVIEPIEFALAGTAVTVTAGATTSNTSTITLTSLGGFTGSVSLTAAITSSPSGAKDPPTLTFGNSSPVDISGSGGKATLTIATTAPSQSALGISPHSRAPWYRGGAALAILLLVAIPRKRDWRSLIGLVAVAMMITGGLVACGGGGSGGGGGGGGGDSGTTKGTYTITVTGKADTHSSTTTITLTVQ